MEKDNYLYLEHILSCVDKIISYTTNITQQDFFENELLQDGVIRNLEVIGEATKKISLNFRNEHNNIAWKDIAGMRDILIHDYFWVDMSAVWNTIKIDIPDLKKKVETIIEAKNL